jgi:hypothetical protein
MSKDAITEVREELRQVWLALFWLRMNTDAICPMCHEQCPRRAETAKDRTTLCTLHLKDKHPELLQEQA